MAAQNNTMTTVGTYLTTEQLVDLAKAPQTAISGWDKSADDNAKLRKKIKKQEEETTFWYNMNESLPATLKVIYTTLFNPNNNVPHFAVPRGERGMIMKKNLGEKRRKVNKMIARGTYTVEPSSDEEE
jgi:hypothetical protein